MNKTSGILALLAMMTFLTAIPITVRATTETDTLFSASSGSISSDVNKMRTEIQKLIEQRFFVEAEKKLGELRTYVDINTKPDAGGIDLISSIERHETVALFSAQGQYEKAAEAISQAISIKEFKGDEKILLDVQKKAKLQQEWFDFRLSFEKQAQRFLEVKQPLLLDKLAILKQIDTNKKLSNTELKKLQNTLQQINAKLFKVSKEQLELRRAVEAKQDNMHKAGVVFSADQLRLILPLTIERMTAWFKDYNLQKQVTRRLTSIAENTQISWKDLKADFSAVLKLKQEILNLRKKLNTYAEKAPLDEADYKSAKEIRGRLEKAIDASKKLMSKAEDAFVDAKTFERLSDKERLELVKLFHVVWSRDKEIDSLRPPIGDLYTKIFNGQTEPANAEKQRDEGGDKQIAGVEKADATDSSVAQPSQNDTRAASEPDIPTSASASSSSAPSSKGLQADFKKANQDIDPASKNALQQLCDSFNAMGYTAKPYGEPKLKGIPVDKIYVNDRLYDVLVFFSGKKAWNPIMVPINR